jgi:hypothetical protein
LIDILAAMIADVDDNSLGEADVPDGPRDIEGVWDFSTAAIEQLKADPKGEFFMDNLKEAITEGVFVNTDYSGFGCAEMATRMIIDAASKALDCVAPVTFWRASDILPHARKVLKTDSRSSPHHVFGNILEHVPRVIRRELVRAHEAASDEFIKRMEIDPTDKKLLDRIGSKLMAALIVIMEGVEFDLNQRRWCYKCRQMCLVHEPHELDPAITRIAVAGTTCTSWSSLGMKNAWMAQSALPFVVWAFLVLAWLPNFIVHECTARFDMAILERIFRSSYLVCSYVFSPVIFGIPANRTRRYTLMILRGTRRLMMPFSPHGFGYIFQRSMLINGHIFWCAPSAAVDAQIRCMARRRGLPETMPDGSQWPMLTVIAPGLRIMFLQYLSCIEKKKITEPIICNLAQRPLFWNCWSAIMPALLRRTTTLWSLAHERLLLPCEHLAVQGVPIFLPGREPSERFSVETLSLNGELNDESIRKLAGNGMALSAVGNVIVFALACSEKIDS